MAEQDVVLWNAIIAGYAHNGSSKEPLELFENMLQAGMRPDYITFIAVLNGCINEGLVQAGYRYFESMDRDHYITPRVEHYACMINLLGSAGHMDEVKEFINNMPFEPNAIMWKSLLNACRIHGNIELAKRAAECLLDLEPENSDTYLMLANVYSSAGRLHEAAEVIKMMNQRM
jgi:pentatricopeptide repeat protein